MASIPERIIDEVMQRSDIIEVISSYIPLKKLGRNYKALCPFHHEKTPSFVVSPERQIYHCFGCGAGGNVYSFLMQYERLEFPEAVELLAKKAGVNIPEGQGQGASNNKDNKEQLYKINGLACNFYAAALNKEGSGAYNYLKARGIAQETVSKFRLGYAPDKWDGLLDYLRAKNIPLGLIEKTGLIIPRDGGGYYDRFRNRLIVPIIDVKDRVIAFGARVLDNSLPKYINSPETPIYSKSRNFYGLNLAKEAIRQADAAVIVEGYFDLITPHQAGLNNLIASCGTALTQEQAGLLKRWTCNVVILYDSDSAGQAASLRGLDLLIEEDLNVRVAQLPQGYDPDSYLQKLGVQKFAQLIEEAKDFFDYKLSALKKTHNTRSIIEKAKVISEMLATITKFNNAVVKSTYIKKLSEDLEVDESSLLVELKKAAKNEPEYNKYRKPGINSPLTPLSWERMIVKFMLQEQDLIARLSGKVKPVDFQDDNLSRIVSAMFDLFAQDKKVEPKALINFFSGTEAAGIVCELTASECPQPTDRDKLICDCLKRIEDSKRKRRQEKLQSEIKAAQEAKDETRLAELLREFQVLTRNVRLKKS